MARQIVIDGSNVAHEENSQEGKPKIANLLNLERELKERGYDPITIVDARLFHIIDDPDQLDALIKKNEIDQAPAGTEADYWVLETAERHNAQVISNDRFDEYQEQYPWIRERRVPFMIVEGHVELYEPALKDAKEAENA